MSATVVIEVFADVGCPFTHVGLRRFVARRAALGRGDVRLRVRSWPLEIVNGEPFDAGFIAEEVEGLRAQVAADLFAGFRAERFPASTLAAMALASEAYEVGLDEGEKVSLELRDLLFEQGVDVSRPKALDHVANRHALLAPTDPLDPGAVLADHAEGVARGVIGSPHWFTPRGDFFCPALDIQRDEQKHLRITADLAAFDAFVDGCFG